MTGLLPEGKPDFHPSGTCNPNAAGRHHARRGCPIFIRYGEIRKTCEHSGSCEPDIAPPHARHPAPHENPFALPDDGKTRYKLMVLNDSPAAFGMGESRVINLTTQPLAVKAGEHSRKVPPAKVVTVPPVTKVNDLNQAQTLFYRKADKEWVLLAERPMQHAATLRNIFLMYLIPNVEEPQIRTLIDTSTPR